ncbi:MAG: tetratricopeptide repeat protein [Microbacteriaceae bacterium]
MSDPLGKLEQRRDQALRDLVELTEQRRRGELSTDVEAGLRRSYEQEAAAAIAALDRLPMAEEPVETRRRLGNAGVRLPLRLHPRQLLYALGALALVVAAVIVPGYVLGRPAGGFVTGNEALQGSSRTRGTDPTSAPQVDLTKVTDKEFEAIVQANPDAVGMRLVLADRYITEGRYDLAAVHYQKVLEKDPANAVAEAHLGWIMLQLDRPTEAARLVDQALATDPKQLEALWFKANILLYGKNDPQGALNVLDTMRARQDLSTEVLSQVDQLRASASALLTGGQK